jgi:excisionase family DNA binding protein
MTGAEVARLFGVTRATISNWVGEGRLPVLRTLGGHFRFPRDEIMALYDSAKRLASEGATRR